MHPTHPILALLHDQPVERLRWLIGAVMMEAAEVDAVIALVFEAIPEAADAPGVEQWRRAAWGQSGDQLAKALEQAGEVWPKGPELAVEYRRLYDARNVVAHGLHHPMSVADDRLEGNSLAFLSTRFLRVKRSADAVPDLDVRRREESELYALYCDLEDLRQRVLDDAPDWFA
jgi:hypothetical protein